MLVMNLLFELKTQEQGADRWLSTGKSKLNTNRNM